MSKRPFNKIRRLDKKQNLQQAPTEGEQEQTNNSRQTHNIAPKLSLEKHKKIKIINEDALKNEQNQQLSHKPSLGSKPNLFKGKKQGGKLLLNANRNSKAETDKADQSIGQAPKPTPMAIKKRFNLGLKKTEKQRENVVIEEESNRFELDQNEAQESTSLKRKPDMKIRRFLEKRQVSERRKEEESEEFAGSMKEEQKSRQFYNPPMPIEYREIDVQPSAAGMSEGRIDKQNKRTKDLRKLLNLQIDLYEQTLSLSSVTPYEIYINKIKGGFLINSSDQAFDETTSNSCQTLPLQYNDFTNQCPQDYAVDINKITNTSSDTFFQNFILKVAPVIEELIKPADIITDPPIFLLAFRPSFKAFMKCPYPVFVYRSQQFNLDLVVMGEKLFIVEGEIASLLMIGKNLIGGLQNGYLVLWNGTNNKGSRLYGQIKEFTQSTNFQLPSFVTHQLQRFSSFTSNHPIVTLLSEERGQFSSLDASGKVVKWSMEETINNNEILKPLRVIQLKNLTQHWSLQAYQMQKRNDRHYVSTSLGILCLNETEISQKLDTEGIKPVNFAVPVRSPLVYVITESNSLLIYNELYSERLLEMSLQMGSASVKQIIIPHIDHENRQIFYLFVVYLIDSQGHIFEVKLLDNKVQYVEKLGEQQERQKGVIFKGVSRVGESLQTVQLMRDLKIRSSFTPMRVNTKKSISNLKQIIEQNRELMTMLQGQSVMVT